MSNIQSFIRWAGGKSWLVPYIKELTQNINYKNYHEPFMGGASVFFSLEVKNQCYLSDINDDLVNAFVALRDNPRKVISYLNKYDTDEKSYYIIRDLEPTSKYERAARFIYLNANSFNGLYRVNKDGKYNVPYGKRNMMVNPERLLDASKKLKSAVIVCQDFDKSIDVIQKNDLVFLDPPYTVSKDKNGFIEYNATFFSLDDQYRLRKFVDEIDKKKAYFILTNAFHEKILEIFDGCGRVICQERNSLIGGKNSYRGKIQEYIFTNIPEVAEIDG